MNIPLLEKYCKLMNELMTQREANGGELDDEVESWYSERLDYIWWNLSDEEHEQYEKNSIEGTK